MSKIIVYICIPDCLLKKAIAPKKAYIWQLLEFYDENSSDYLYIYNGSLIDSKTTIEQNNVADGDVLLAVKKQNNDTNFNIKVSLQIKKLVKDQSFEGKLRLLTNQKIKMERSRIMDLKHLRIERYRKLFIKKTKDLLQNQNDQIGDQFDLNTNYQPSIEPSEEAMPILW